MTSKKSLLASTLIVAVFLALSTTAISEPTESEPQKLLLAPQEVFETTYTPTTKTVCDENDKCMLTLYSGIRQVYEDEQWKLVEEARSLLGYYDIVYLEKEDAFNIEVIDFNLTDIELETTFLGDPQDYPEFCDYKSEQEFKCQFKNNVKWDECIYPEDSEPICTEQTIKYDMKYGMKDGEIVANDTKFQYKGIVLNKKYSFGGNSTTITLKDGNALEDASVDEGSPTTNYGSDDTYDVGRKSGDAERAYTKFNILPIPSGQTIEDANFYIHIFWEFLEPGESYYISMHHVYEQTWIEEVLTWNNQPCGAGFDQSSDCNLTSESTVLYSDGDTTIWIRYPAVNSVRKAYNDGDANISFVLKSPEDDADTDTIRYESKEAPNTALHPYLKVTYSTAPPADSCTCAASGTWAIVDADTCTLTDTCDLAGDMHIQSGSLTIATGGLLVVPEANKLIIEDDQNLIIQGGEVIVR